MDLFKKRDEKQKIEDRLKKLQKEMGIKNHKSYQKLLQEKIKKDPDYKIY